MIDLVHLQICGIEDILVLLGDRPLYSAILCSVVGIDIRLVESLRRIASGDVVVLTGETPLPVILDYLTPSTLGHDRIADAVGAAYMFPGENVIIADAGSALTPDIVSAEGKFLGGNISPGLSMRFRALSEFTGCLPSVTYRDAEIPVFGKDTCGAIRAGVVRGITAEIEKFALEAKKKLGSTVLILTGGHAPFLSEFLRMDGLEIICEPHLLVKGLNRILIYNETI